MIWTDHSVIRGPMGGVLYPVCPVPAPRQVRSDKWKPRPMVQKYRAFRDHIRLLKPRVENGAEIIFYLPMPKSWSKKKKSEMDGQPHRQTPDLDNLAKSFLDSVFDSDAHFSALCLEKYWAKQGGIEVVNEQG